MENCYNYSDYQMDVLREIGNIGAGNAATALAEILGNRVTISVPQLKISDVSNIAAVLGGPEKEVVGILVKMINEVEGMLLFLLDKESVNILINVLVNESADCFEDISEIGLSALSEIGNILSGSYINSLCTLTGLDIRLTSPQTAVDMAGAILSYPAAFFGLMGDKILFIEECFFTAKHTVKSHLLIMPEAQSLNIILDKLGVG